MARLRWLCLLLCPNRQTRKIPFRQDSDMERALSDFYDGTGPFTFDETGTPQAETLSALRRELERIYKASF